MSELILHAGAPKTGTSYLQVLFAKHAQALLKHQLVYPKGFMFNEASKGEITSGNGVELANFIDPTLPHKAAQSPEFLKKFETSLEKRQGKKILYSSEFLFFKQGERLEAIKEIIKKYKYKVRVVYFVRNIGSGAFSTYCQQIKRHGETRPFDEFIRTWDPMYKFRLMQIESAFGKDALQLYNYSQHSSEVASLFFKDILGLDFIPDDQQVINRSLTVEETELLRLLNSQCPGNSQYSDFISSALLAMDKPESEKFQITKKEQTFLRNKFHNALEYINERIIGDPCIVEDTDIEERQLTELRSFEVSTIAILGKLIRANLSNVSGPAPRKS